MLLAPVVVGAVDSGARPVHLLLLVAWVVGYLAYNATGLWLKARRRARWWPPVRAYGAVAVVLTAALLLVEPTLVRWGVVLAPAAAVSLTASARRTERSWTNDLVAVGAAGVMGVVAHGLGADGVPGALGPGAGSARAWFLVLVLTAYFAGTVPYVKSMIRERGNPAVLRASVGVHALLAAVAVGWAIWVVAGPPGARGTVAGGPAAGVALALIALALLARAAGVPRYRPGVTPLQLGIGEIVATVALSATLLTLV